MKVITERSVDLLEATFSGDLVGWFDVEVFGKNNFYSLIAFKGGPYFAYLHNHSLPPILLPVITGVQYVNNGKDDPHVLLGLEHREKLDFYSPLGGLVSLGNLQSSARNYIERLEYFQQNIAALQKLKSIFNVVKENDRPVSSKKVKVKPSVEIVELVHDDLKSSEKVKGDIPVVKKEHEVSCKGLKRRIEEEPPQQICYKRRRVSTPKPVDQFSRDLATFKERFHQKMLQDLKTWYQNHASGRDATTKLVCRDGTQFNVNRGILCARSPIFRTMFQTNSGQVKINDIHSKAMDVFLYFVHTGELKDNWKELGILEGLTYAAHKYELKDLLEFLKLSLGHLVNQKSCGRLMCLAKTLGLEQAEKQLMGYFKQEVTSIEQRTRIMSEANSVLDWYSMEPETGNE